MGIYDSLILSDPPQIEKGGSVIFLHSDFFFFGLLAVDQLWVCTGDEILLEYKPAVCVFVADALLQSHNCFLRVKPVTLCPFLTLSLSHALSRPPTPSHSHYLGHGEHLALP